MPRRERIAPTASSRSCSASRIARRVGWPSAWKISALSRRSSLTRGRIFESSNIDKCWGASSAPRSADAAGAAPRSRGVEVCDQYHAAPWRGLRDLCVAEAHEQERLLAGRVEGAQQRRAEARLLD